MNDGVRILSESDLRDVTTTKQTQYGAIGQTEDGRTFRYVGVGASTVAAGLLTVAPAKVANHENRSLASTSNVAVGSRVIQVSVGATAATQDQYLEGYLSVVDGTGKGALYRISGNTAVSSAGGTVNVTLADPIATALAVADTKVTLIASPWAAVVTSTTASKAAGVTTVSIAAGNFGWVQTGGYAPVLADGAVTKSYGVIQSTSVAGAVVVASAATNQVLGYAPEALVDTKYYTVALDIQ